MKKNNEPDNDDDDYDDDVECGGSISVTLMNAAH